MSDTASIRASIYHHLTAIVRIPSSNSDAFTAQIIQLDNDLQSTLPLLEANRHPESVSSLIASLQLLQGSAEHWVLQKSPRLSQADMQYELKRLKKRFKPSFFPGVCLESSAYRQAIRAAAGFLEGISSPALLLWRTGFQLYAGRLSIRAIVSPHDWRRRGFVFAASLFYGSLLCVYFFAWLALRYKRPQAYFFSLVSLAYGVGHLFYAAFQFLS